MSILVSSFFSIYPTPHMIMAWRQSLITLLNLAKCQGTVNPEYSEIENKWAPTTDLLQLELWNFMIICLE